MARTPAGDLEEALALQATVNAPLIRNPKGGGHAFARVGFLIPAPCVVCHERVMLLATPCRCLLCGCAAHRACISRLAAPGAAVPHPCESSIMDSEQEQIQLISGASASATDSDIIEEAEPTPDPAIATAAETVAGEECLNEDELAQKQQLVVGVQAFVATTAVIEDGPCYADGRAGVDDPVSLLDDSLTTRQARRATALVGAAAFGTIAGGFIGSACGIIAIGRVTIALSGATVAYRKARQGQLSGLVIPPPGQDIPLFWAEAASAVRKSRVWAHTHSRFTAADQEQQRQVDECALEEKVR